MGRIEPDWAQHWQQLAVEEAPHPGPLPRIPFGALQKADVLCGQQRQEFIVQNPVLLGDQCMGGLADRAQLFHRRHQVWPRLPADREHDLLLQSGDTDLEEFVEIAACNAQKAQALEQRIGLVSSLLQDSAIELEQGQLAIDIKLRIADPVGFRIHSRFQCIGPDVWR